MERPTGPQPQLANMASYPNGKLMSRLSSIMSAVAHRKLALQKLANTKIVFHQHSNQSFQSDQH